MPRLNFSVDSALLKELGERLVGAPHIALSELIKNSYDADASNVEIEFNLEKDLIIIKDDGHGMDYDEFKKYWMRVGSPHKAEKRVSKFLGRSMPGSKGVGRLSVQFLAHEMELITVPQESSGWLSASVDWDEAVKAGELTKASIVYGKHEQNPPIKKGTIIKLKNLKEDWKIDDIKDLAGEIWWLQSPFDINIEGIDPKKSFNINFLTQQQGYRQVFEEQLTAILDIWTARISGKNERGNVSMSLEFYGENPQIYSYKIEDLPHNNGKYIEGKNLFSGSFDIRIYTLKHRQPKGIKVGEARQYFWDYGGVHVYDGGFHLPYYGGPENDWLLIEFDHAHRKFVSELLPSDIQADYINTERLRYLPTLGRIFGVVKVSTSEEENLDIMITRDRLAESKAFEDLKSIVRYSLDLYSYEKAKRVYREKLRKRKTDPTSIEFETVEQTLLHYENKIPKNAYEDIREKVKEATTSVKAYKDKTMDQLSLLGPLATAGISSLAVQHELEKQFGSIEDLIIKFDQIKVPLNLVEEINDIKNDLKAWLDRARNTYSLFNYLADAENVQDIERFSAREVLGNIKDQTRFFGKGTKILLEVDEDLLLPKGTLAEWSAIFQNVYTNAYSAMLGKDKKLLGIESRKNKTKREIIIQDTGIGVNLDNADELFEPFTRKLDIEPAYRALGYGGTGLGLTIVRLLARRLGCSVRFIEPSDGFNTAFSISWKEFK